MSEPVVDRTTFFMVVFIVSFLILAVGCASSTPDEDMEEITSRLKRLETRVTTIEFNHEADNERDKQIERFMADSERRQADLMIAVSKIEEQIQGVVPKDDKKVSPEKIEDTAIPPVPPVKEKALSQAPSKEAAVDQPNYYQVQKGDTVYSISQQHNLEPDALKKMNNLESDVIMPGQKLRVR